MFDYEAATDPDAVLLVADEIKATPKPPSDEERWLVDLDRQNQVEANRRWHEQQQLHRERAQAEQAEVAQREQAIAAAQARDKARHEQRHRDAEQARDQQLVALQIRTAQQEAWQANVMNAAKVAENQRWISNWVAEFDAMINPPEPPPEPEVVYEGEEDDGPVTHRWFTR